jgi:hypothetical protein
MRTPDQGNPDDCAVRFIGAFLAEPTDAVAYVAAQLRIRDVACLEDYATRRAVWRLIPGHRGGDPAGRLWTGMPYSNEGGLFNTGACIVGFLLIAAWVRLRRGSVGVHPSLAQPPTRPAITAGLPEARAAARPG